MKTEPARKIAKNISIESDARRRRRSWSRMSRRIVDLAVTRSTVAIVPEGRSSIARWSKATRKSDVRSIGYSNYVRRYPHDGLPTCALRTEDDRRQKVTRPNDEADITLTSATGNNRRPRLVIGAMPAGATGKRCEVGGEEEAWGIASDELFSR